MPVPFQKQLKLLLLKLPLPNRPRLERRKKIKLAKKRKSPDYNPMSHEVPYSWIFCGITYNSTNEKGNFGLYVEYPRIKNGPVKSLWVCRSCGCRYKECNFVQELCVLLIPVWELLYENWTLDWTSKFPNIDIKIVSYQKLQFFGFLKKTIQTTIFFQINQKLGEFLGKQMLFYTFSGKVSPIFWKTYSKHSRCENSLQKTLWKVSVNGGVRSRYLSATEPWWQRTLAIFSRPRILHCYSALEVQTDSLLWKQ